MMYATVADLQAQLRANELTQLADDDADGTADQAVLDRAIADAQAEIDGYLGTRYTVPLATVPTLIRRLAVDLAIWNLYCRRDLMTDARKLQYESARKILKGLAEGTVTLGLPPSQQASPPPSIVSGDRLFTRTRTRGF